MIRKTIALVLLAAGLSLTACKNTGSEKEMMMMANDTCPISGHAVDKASFYEYDGTKIYTCCDKCIAKVKEDPAMAKQKAYGK